VLIDCILFYQLLGIRRFTLNIEHLFDKSRIKQGGPSVMLRLVCNVGLWASRERKDTSLAAITVLLA
jgi:hypothetical protein